MAEIDTEDTSQRDAAEAALGLAIATTILDNGQTRNPPRSGWYGLLKTTAFPVLWRYLRGNLVAMSVDAGSIGRRVSPYRVDQISSSVADRRIVEIADWAQKATTEMHRLPTPGRAPALDTDPTTITIERPADLSKRVRVESDRIARSATTAAREEARSQLAIDLGATFKVWRTRHDSKVRISHGTLEGTAVPLSSAFRAMDGSVLRFPGDPLAPLHETAGCRCRLSYRLAVR